jgi:hypothetical protein
MVVSLRSPVVAGGQGTSRLTLEPVTIGTDLGLDEDRGSEQEQER